MVHSAVRTKHQNMEDPMRNTTLKSKIKLQIIVGILALLMVMFGVRLMSKVTDFAYYERQHILAATEIQYELTKEQPEKSHLLNLADTAIQQPKNVHNAIFSAEKLLLRLLGQGFLLDICTDDIQDLSVVIDSLNKVQGKYLTAEETTKTKELMKRPIEISIVFGTGLRETAGVVKTVVISLGIIVIGALVTLLVNMMRSTIPPLEKMASILEGVAQGDLTVSIDKMVGGEIGQMQRATMLMIEGLRKAVQAITQSANDLSAAAGIAANITEQTLEGVQTQKTETENLTIAIGEMGQAVNEVANSAANAENSANDGNQAALKGKQIVTEAVTSIDSLAREVEHSSNAIRQIESD
nr:methyl-accepting chemotaxis protein [Colwellia sp.]